MVSRLRRGVLRSAWDAVLLAALLPAGAIAGTTGKIEGRVLDAAKKQPLAGVNVAIPAARTGAITDEQGRYVILNVPAGTYEAKLQLLGYRAVTIQNIVVTVDNTTRLADQAMEETALAMPEVVVSAKRPVVDIGLTSNLQTVGRREIEKLPVQDLQDVVNLQAGVVDGHIRGGRIGEVQYQVDGVTMNDPVTNQAGLKLDRSLLEEVQVVSGTFDAEYGQAMSGVVNAVLRRGTSRFDWNAEAYLGSFVYPGNADARGTPYEFHPTGIQSYQMSVSGPLASWNTTYLLNAHAGAFDDYVDATRRFTPWQAKTPLDKIATANDSTPEVSPLGRTRAATGVVRLTNHSIPGVELNYQAIVEGAEGRKTNYLFRLNPDGLTDQHTLSLVQGIDWTHTLNTKTFYTLSLRQNLFDYRDLKYDDLFDPRYVQAGAPRNYPGYEADAWVMGVDLGRYKQWTNTPIIKGSFVNQRSHDQQIKFGGEYQWPHVEYGSPGYLVDLGTSIARIVDQPPNFPAIPRWRPDIAAAFAQDELEWNDLHLRAGLRFDYFSARASVPSDLANPANSIAGAPASVPVATTPKTALSPRIGVSYPVTRNAALFFAYGHFYQFPELGQIFTQADYSILADLQAGGISYGVMGNPDIKPERTVQYQFGYKQSITDDFGIDATIFYKDIRDLLGTEFVTTYNGAEYARLTNVDFGTVTGITLSVTRRAGRVFSTTLDYTWQNAQGNSSDPHETATRASNGEDPRPRSVPFNWDQRHTLVLTVTAAQPESYNASMILHAATGQPFTPATSTGFGNGLEDNSGRKPAVLVIDLRAEKNVNALHLPVSAFMRVFNLTDARFNNGFVFNTSGSPYYSRFPAKDYVTLADPTRYYAPRRIEVGVTLRGRP
jgi:outer membrane receptor protein involved in Fe transport